MRYGPKRSTDAVPNWYSAYRYMSSKRRARGSFSLNVDSEKFRVGINTLEPLTDTIILRTGAGCVGAKTQRDRHYAEFSVLTDDVNCKYTTIPIDIVQLKNFIKSAKSEKIRLVFARDDLTVFDGDRKIILKSTEAGEPKPVADFDVNATATVASNAIRKACQNRQSIMGIDEKGVHLSNQSIPKIECGRLRGKMETENAFKIIPTFKNKYALAVASVSKSVIMLENISRGMRVIQILGLKPDADARAAPKAARVITRTIRSKRPKVMDPEDLLRADEINGYKESGIWEDAIIEMKDDQIPTNRNGKYTDAEILEYIHEKAARESMSGAEYDMRELMD